MVILGYIFQAEVIYLGQLRHQNLVKLIGYCCENEQRILVYEYMARGSLDNHLFPSEFLIEYIIYYRVFTNYFQKFDNNFVNVELSIAIPWLTTIKIALGAAKGLAFLHESSKSVILTDFKAANILLDSVSRYFKSNLKFLKLYFIYRFNRNT